MESIVPPLQAEINNLLNDVQSLNKALSVFSGAVLMLTAALSNTASCCSSRKAVEQSRTGSEPEALTATDTPKAGTRKSARRPGRRSTEGVTETGD